jgi:hypothetical protein
MLSALKTLNPLDDQGENGEGRDGQHDVEDVGHLGLLVTRANRSAAGARPVGLRLLSHDTSNAHGVGVSEFAYAPLTGVRAISTPG